MLEDVQRGGAWTRAFLGLPAKEIHLCGHECAIDIVKRLAQSMRETLEVCGCVCVYGCVGGVWVWVFMGVWVCVFVGVWEVCGGVSDCACKGTFSVHFV